MIKKRSECSRVTLLLQLDQYLQTLAFLLFFLSSFLLSFFPFSWKYILKLKVFNDESQGLFAVWPKMLSEIQLPKNIGWTIFTAIQGFSNWPVTGNYSSPSGSITDHTELIYHLQLLIRLTLLNDIIAYLPTSHLLTLTMPVRHDNTALLQSKTYFLSSQIDWKFYKSEKFNWAEMSFFPLKS